MIKGNIFDIQGFSLHDGPGCRTLIFLKGCTLNCLWCSNPEGADSFPVPLFQKQRCLKDYYCIKACPFGAIIKSKDGVNIDRSKCRECSDHPCAEVCNSAAIRIAGNNLTVDELMKSINRDRQYWGADGGITLTGGEPFMQAEFTTEILKRCYEAYIHTAIETCGNIAWQNINISLEYLDWIFFDFKHIDEKKHKFWTGSDNKLIKANLQKLITNFTKRLIIRIPIVTGFNDTEEEIDEISDYLAKHGVGEVNILQLHHLGKEKYDMMGKKYYSDNINVPSKAKMETFSDIIESKGIKTYIAYKTPF